MVTPGVDDLLIIGVEAVRSLVVGLGERIHDQLIAFADIGCFLQFGIEVILHDADPVERIRENAGHLTGTRSLVGGLYQALNRQRIAKRAMHACGNTRPLRNLFLVLRHVGEQLACLGCSVRVTEDRIEVAIALAGHIGGKARRLKSGVQLALRNAVFLGRAVECNKRSGHACNSRTGNLDTLLRKIPQRRERFVLECDHLAGGLHHAVINVLAGLLSRLGCRYQTARHLIL